MFDYVGLGLVTSRVARVSTLAPDPLGGLRLGFLLDRRLPVCGCLIRISVLLASSFGSLHGPGSLALHRSLDVSLKGLCQGTAIVIGVPARAVTKRYRYLLVSLFTGLHLTHRVHFDTILIFTDRRGQNTPLSFSFLIMI